MSWLSQILEVARLFAKNNGSGKQIVAMVADGMRVILIGADPWWTPDPANGNEKGPGREPEA